MTLVFYDLMVSTAVLTPFSAADSNIQIGLGQLNWRFQFCFLIKGKAKWVDEIIFQSVPSGKHTFPPSPFPSSTSRINLDNQARKKKVM